MKVAVWGAGEVGWFLATRLTISPVVTELIWINRTFDRIERRCVDLEQGLAFAPTCRSVLPRREDDVQDLAPMLDLLILTPGNRVPKGATRAESYVANRELFEEKIRPFLAAGFKGLVLVVTNPVELMARVVVQWNLLHPSRVLGLGTVVETARLRKALASYLPRPLPAREVWAYAIGTHDEQFVPVASPRLGPGADLDPDGFSDILESCRLEVVGAAARVKRDDHSTLHPVVEGIVQVVESIGLDRRELLTVSSLDPESAEGLCYALPSEVGREGLIYRRPPPSPESVEGRALQHALAGMRKVLGLPTP